MTTKTTQTVEDILRPLAERTVECLGTDKLGDVVLHGPKCCFLTERIPDPRFAALRKPPKWINPMHGQYGGIDASPGAILRAIQACRIEISLTLFKESRDIRETWCVTWPWPSDRRQAVYADTPEEALALALVKAVGDENSPSGTRSDEGKA